MITEVRSSWQVMRASITALFIRNIQKKFITSINSSRSLGVFLVFFEPLLHVLIWMIMRVSMGLGASNGLSPPLFILLGAVPFLFIRNAAQKSTGLIKANKALFNFRQIRPIDPIIATILTELSIGFVVFMALLGVFSWVGMPWRVHNLGFLLANTCSFILLATGLSLIMAIACFFFNIIKTMMTILTRVFYLLSGVFFNADYLPEHLRNILLCNPVFQYIEIIRQCFNTATIHHDYTDPLYLFKCSIISFVFGLGLYVASRERILIEIQQR